MRDTTREFARWLDEGGQRVGQVRITRLGKGWELRHVDDVAREDLTLWEKATDARELANLDERGAFRPLKTAPNLRRGWRLVLGSVGDLRKAVDAFYPAMAGVWSSYAAGEVAPVDLRETLGRQTGMYRVVQKLTDAQAQEVIARTCNDGACLKTILWRIDRQVAVTSLPREKFERPELNGVRSGPELPLLCQEACNILVAAARKAVKGETE